MLKVLAIATLALSLSSPNPSPAEKIEDGLPQEIKVEKIEFQTRVVKDSNLPQGIEVEVQKGSEGKRVFFKSSRQMISDNGAYEKVPVYYDEVIDLPIEKVIRRGANKSVIEGVSEKTLELEKVKAVEAKEKAEEDRYRKIQDETSKATSDSESLSIDSESLRSPRDKISSSATGVTSAAENRAYARSILSESEFRIADQLVNRESGWKTTATNPSSGAYGVPQSLPASKLASAGPDWRTNGKTQFNWMIKYVSERYGSWSGALAHSNRVGWY